MKSELVPDLTSGDGSEVKELTTYDEFHPVLFKQHANLPHKEFDSFDQVEPEPDRSSLIEDEILKNT